ncbi:MAG: hypothetical protein JOZ48_04070 [Acidobacteriaceae bacterium]|nr:hypothetical protein [Acidobacteriaceae bacterium]
MKRFLLLLAFFFFPAFSWAITFQANGTDAAPWAKILGSVGITQTKGGGAGIVVAGPGAQIDAATVSENQILILEGAGGTAQGLGFSFKSDMVAVRQIHDEHAPKMQIIWEQAVSVPLVTLPEGFQVFAAEKWKNVPVLAGKRTAHGAILWMATEPGASGMERYPYLLQALVDLGLTLPLKATNLWAFFDSSYRIRADVDYLARRWRQSGIGVLHVAAWHNVEPNAANDEYLKNLIEACHRNAILVYAWLELPHVSEKFWADHPEWREKTALGQDAQLDWRKLMNLQNPDCHREVAKEIDQLLREFDWDGVNVAELYFESLEGASNPARFTPMNDDVRAEFKKSGGFDPKLLFDPSSPYSKDPQALRKFLDFRAELASRMQADWLDVIDRTRSAKPYLDVVLTHIDDRFEPGIRDALGADIARSLPLIQARKSTLLVEDPATLWDLGPERYSKIAQKYRELTPDRRQIAVDINVVERYQDVYPTKKQTGVELLELIHEAAASFARVALYFENSIEKEDLSLLPAAATTGEVVEQSADELQVDAPEVTRVAWQGPVELDGNLWPVQNSRTVLMPAGKHTLRTGMSKSAITISDFNGELRSALASGNRVDVSYTSRSRAVAMLGSPVSSIEVDGAPFWKPVPGAQSASIMLPAGQHLVTFNR